MSIKKVLTSYLLLLVALTTPAWSADDLMTSYMVDQAHEWEQKDRPDRALDIWRNILRVSPNHPEALTKLGLANGQNSSIGKPDLSSKPQSPVKPQLHESNSPTRAIQPTKVVTPLAPSKPLLDKPSTPTPQNASVETISPPLPPHLPPSSPAMSMVQPHEASQKSPVVLPKLEKLKLKLSDSLDWDSTQRKQ